MKSNPAMVIITNLYPLPWEPNRAKFNHQQFELLKSEYALSILVPVAFPEWLKHRKQITQSDAVRYLPYFYTPKIGRRFYSVMMFLSLLIHSGFWLKRKQAKIIMASWAFPEAVASSWLAKLFGARFFFKVHGSDINQLAKDPARAQQIKYASQNALGILSVSQALAKEMASLGINQDKVSVIYNGVDHQKFGVDTKRPFEQNYLLYVGNLKVDKGVVELYQGFAEVADQHLELQLVYAGTGAMKATIEQQAKADGLAERVHFLGSVQHALLPAWISHAQLLALPSYAEGVPNVVLEAMACGTPVLATTVGGIPEVMDASQCGVLIPPKDATAVAVGITKILTSDWDKQAIKQHASRFSWQVNQQQFLSMLKNGEA
ncbi:glycosyltransferase [Agarivorans sp. 1_MG-2023]|uniref:glycosyltransferase n=1 Tax=Agarivorans sp. 1_MG-2023 TaxID=3062634 RepID=UPI0026E36851|nr:glycosyltransferase [Agarivorans sp. 1_MG-2023]MDO6763561.1 glycosyltransferase [Agarivorans sp. 1_MG-2023]